MTDYTEVIEEVIDILTNPSAHGPVTYWKRNDIIDSLREVQKELAEYQGALETGTKAIEHNKVLLEDNTRLRALAKLGHWCLLELRSGREDEPWFDMHAHALALDLITPDYENTLTELAQLPEETK